MLPGENEKGMGDAGQGSEKSQVKRFFFQEKTPTTARSNRKRQENELYLRFAVLPTF